MDTDSAVVELPVLFASQLSAASFTSWPMKPFRIGLPHHTFPFTATKFFSLLILAAAPWTSPARAAGDDTFYKLGPDSLPQEGVPEGKLMGPATLPSEVFTGTQHTYWVYEPAQYDAKQPTALIVFNDGQAMI